MESAKNSQPRKHPLALLLVSFLLLIGFLYVIFSFPPSLIFSYGFIHISILLPVLFLFFLVLYAISAYLFVNALQGFVIAISGVCLILMQYFFHQWLFTLLFLGIFCSIELALAKKR